MTMMLSGQPGLEIDLAQIQRLQLNDLADANKGQLQAVERVAWGIKELLYDIVVTGAETVQARVELSLNRNLGGRHRRPADRPDPPRRDAQRAAGLVPGAEDRGRGAAQRSGPPWTASAATRRPPSRSGASRSRRRGRRRAAAAGRSTLGGHPTQGRRMPGLLQLAQSSDDLLSDEKLIDKDSLRLEDFELLLQEDAAGDNSGLGNVAPSGGVHAGEGTGRGRAGARQGRPAAARGRRRGPGSTRRRASPRRWRASSRRHRSRA